MSLLRLDDTAARFSRWSPEVEKQRWQKEKRECKDEREARAKAVYPLILGKTSSLLSILTIE